MKEIVDVTRRLLKQVIPAFAKVQCRSIPNSQKNSPRHFDHLPSLQDLNKHVVNLVDHQDLVNTMHSRGINVRYLGTLRGMIYSIGDIRRKRFVLLVYCYFDIDVVTMIMMLFLSLGNGSPLEKLYTYRNGEKKSFIQQIQRY